MFFGVNNCTTIVKLFVPAKIQFDANKNDLTQIRI